MNRIYGLVWNEVRKQYVVVAENTHARGKPHRTLLAPISWLSAIALCAPGLTQAAGALPQGAQVIAGQATVQTLSPTHLAIDQSSNRAIINWSSYNLGAGNSVSYQQPSRQSVTLNRILDNNPSQIAGQISANGQLVFINPNGVVFSGGARVDAAAITVSTRDTTDAAFMAGNPDYITPGTPGAILFNQGTINVDHGGVVQLLADQVSNSGTVSAPGGSVTLDSGTSGTTINSGVIDVSDSTSGGVGGSVTLLGDLVGMYSGSDINASGDAGGGTVQAGGSSKGQGPLPDASAFYMAPDALINASALNNGNGGHIVTWGSNANRSYGTLLAEGGSQGGDGGLIETSGAWLDVNGIQIDTSAPVGKDGTWLLDPSQITIDNSTNTPPTTSPGTWAPSGPVSINSSLINSALSGGNNVLLDTTGGSGGDGSITVNSAISNTSATPSLTFNASSYITINQSINNSGAVVFKANGSYLNLFSTITGASITANANNQIYLNGTNSLNSTTGDINLTSATSYITTDGGTSINSFGNLQLTTNNSSGTITTGILNANGSLTLNSGAGISTNAAIKDSGSGTITLSAIGSDINVNSDITQSGSGNIQLSTQNSGNITDIGNISAGSGASISVTASGNSGSINLSGNKNIQAGGISLYTQNGYIYTASSLLTSTGINGISMTTNNGNNSSTSANNYITADGSSVLSATGGGGITLSTNGGGTINTQNMSTTGGNGSIALITKGTANGTITVGDNPSSDQVSAAGSGNITMNASSGDINLNAALNQTGSGNISLQTNNSGNVTDLGAINAAGSGSSLSINTAGTSGNINLTGNKTVQAGGISLFTQNGNIYTAQSLLTSTGTGGISMTTNNGNNSNTSANNYITADGSSVLASTGGGGIILTTNGGGGINVQTLSASGGNGNVNLTTKGSANGTINVGDTPSSDSITAAGNGNIAVNSSNGDINVNAALNQTGSGSIALSTQNSGNITDNGTVNQSGAQSSLSINNTGSGSVTISNGSGNHYASSINLNAAQGSISVGNNVGLTSTSGDINMTASNNSINEYSSNVSVTSAGNISMTAGGGGNIDATSLQSGGNITLSANTGSITSHRNYQAGGTLTVQTTGSSGGNIRFNSDNSGNSTLSGNGININAASGNIYDSNDVQLQSTGALAITAQKSNINLNGPLTASGNITVLTNSANQNISINQSGNFNTSAINENGSGNIVLAACSTCSAANATNAGNGSVNISGAINPGSGGLYIYTADTGDLSSPNNVYSGFSAGSGSFRYNTAYNSATPTTVNASASVGDGKHYILYRAQPKLTLSVSNATKVYGTPDSGVNLSPSVSGAVNGDTVAQIFPNGVPSLTRSSGENVGSYNYQTGSAIANQLGYLINLNSSAALTITPATLTVTPSSVSKVYGTSDPTLSYSIAGLVNTSVEGVNINDSGLSNAQLFSGALSRASGETVAGGPYAINAGNLASINSNYTLALASGTSANLTITPAALTVTPTSVSKVYGTNDPTLSYSVAGLVNTSVDNVTINDSGLSNAQLFSGSLSRAPGETVAGGPYAISAGNLASINPNYSMTVASSPANLTITPATLSVTPTSVSKVYGSNDPTLSYSVAGLVNTSVDGVNIDDSGLSNAQLFSGSLSRAPGETVGAGPYAINAGTLASINSNYALALASGAQANLTITPVTLTVTPASASKVYGTSDPTLSYSVAGLVSATADGVAIDDTGLSNAQLFSGSLGRASGETVSGGPYAINAGNLASINANYTLSFSSATPANLTITPAALTVTPSSISKVYGSNDPTLSYSVAGLVNTSVDGVNIDDAGLSNAQLFSGSLSRAPGETVAGGPYAISAGNLASINPNYTMTVASAPADLSITPAPLTFSSSSISKVYGTNDPALTGLVSGLVDSTVDGVNLNDTALASQLTLQRASGENAGNYTINQLAWSAGTSSSDISNYTLPSAASETFTITPAPLGFNASSLTKVYGTNDPTLNGLVSGLVDTTVDGVNINDTNLGSDLTVQRQSGENVGSYNITQLAWTSAANSNAIANYTLPSATSLSGDTFSITPAPLTFSSSSISKVYGTNDPTLSGQISGLVNASVDGVDINDTNLASQLTLQRQSGENVGNYTINQLAWAAGSSPTAIANYTLPSAGSETFSITPAPLGFSASTLTKVYGTNDPTLSGLVSGLVDTTVDGVNINDSGLGSDLVVQRQSGENVGSYDITQLTLAAGVSSNALTNYTLPSPSALAGDTFSITPAPLTFASSSISKVYGTNDPSLSGLLDGLVKTTVDGVAINDTSLANQLTLQRASGENVGNYTINQLAWNTGTSASAINNYTLPSTGTETLSITPAALSFSAGSLTKVYGTNDPNLSGLLNGLVDATVDGANINDSGLAAQIQLQRQSGENVGNYAINQLAWSSAVSNSAISDYTLPSTASETLHITPAALTVVPVNVSKSFGVAADPSLTYNVAGLVNATVDGVNINDSGQTEAQLFSGALSRQPGSATGKYAITDGSLAYIGNSNYSYTPATGLATAYLTITPPQANPGLLVGAAWGDLMRAFSPLYRPITPSERDAHELIQDTALAARQRPFDGELVNWSIASAMSGLTPTGVIVLPQNQQ